MYPLHIDQGTFNEYMFQMTHFVIIVEVSIPHETNKNLNELHQMLNLTALWMWPILIGLTVLETMGDSKAIKTKYKNWSWDKWIIWKPLVSLVKF